MNGESAETLVVLFLALDSAGERAARERRRIDERLQEGQRGRFNMRDAHAVDRGSITRALLEHVGDDPAIIHVIAGTEGDALLVEGAGDPHAVDPEAFAAAITVTAPNVRCVALSGCMVEAVTEALLEEVPAVIGTAPEAPDDATIAFFGGFYRSISFRYDADDWRADLAAAVRLGNTDAAIHDLGRWGDIRTRPEPAADAAGAPTMPWIQLKLKAGEVTAETWRGDTARGAFRLSPPLDEVVDVLQGLIAEGRSGELRATRLLGKILYGALLPETSLDPEKPSPRSLFETELGLIDRNEIENGSSRPLLMRLIIDDTDKEDLPWEHLVQGRSIALAKDERVVLARFKPENSRPPEPRNELSVWFAMCNPPEVIQKMVEEEPLRAKRPGIEEIGPMTEVTVRSHLEQMIDDCATSLQENVTGVFVVEDTPEPSGLTPDALTSTLDRVRPDVLHYIGHGSRRDDGPAIALMDDDGKAARWLTAAEFAERLSFAPRLVVLHLYQGQLGSFKVSFRAFAPELLEKGVKAVVAMQFPLGPTRTSSFITSLYTSLGAGKPVDVAVQLARAAVYDTNAEEEGFRFYGQFASPMVYTHVHDELRLVNPRLGEPKGEDRGTGPQLEGYAGTPGGGEPMEPSSPEPEYTPTASVAYPRRATQPGRSVSPPRPSAPAPTPPRGEDPDRG